MAFLTLLCDLISYSLLNIVQLQSMPQIYLPYILTWFKMLELAQCLELFAVGFLVFLCDLISYGLLNTAQL